MGPTGKLFYPLWVQPKSLIIGDVSYRREDLKTTDWDKYIYTGRQWVQYAVAPPKLKKTSELRQMAQHHIKLTRETGI